MSKNDDNKPQTAFESAMNEVVALLTSGIECWQRAGEILCRVLDTEERSLVRIREQYPQMDVHVLRTLEKIGRRQVVPQLLLKSGAGWQALRRMPFDVQKRYLELPVRVLVLTEHGPDVLQIEIDNLTPAQVRQVFGDADVRDEAAQRAWLAGQVKPLPLPAETRRPYEIHGGKIVVRQPFEMDAQALATELMIATQRSHRKSA